MYFKNSALSLKVTFTISLLLILLFSKFNNLHSQTSTLNPDSIPFTTPIGYRGVDVWQNSIFAADLDGDEDLDLAVTSRWADSISILNNNGDGTFLTRVTYKVGDDPSSVFCADLDGDLDFDLVVANTQEYTVSILKNNGDGTFQTKVDYGAEYHPYSVYCADLDGDIDLDLAVANISGYWVSVLKNNGNGTFQPKVDYTAGYFPYSIFCTDIDGDLDSDLAVANLRSDNVTILKNNGDGTFQDSINYAAGDSPFHIFCADLDGDDDVDLAVANWASDSISILRNNGDGTFQPKVDYDAGGDPLSVFCSDLDGDGDQDLAVANGDYRNVAILKNNGDGTFKTPVKYGIGTWYYSRPRSVFCADLDGDKDLDIAVTDELSVMIFILKNLTFNLSLLMPADQDSVANPIEFIWQAVTFTDSSDTVKYNLSLSRSSIFNPDSTLIYDNLLDTTFTDGLEIGLWYWKVKAYDQFGNIKWSDPSRRLFAFYSGDCNGNSEISVSDAVYLLSFLFKGGPEPSPFLSGEVNCDEQVNVSDVIYLVNYLFKGGPPPGC